jgi:predicted nucleotidyltransferase
LELQKFIATEKGDIEVNLIGWDVKHAMGMISKSNFAIVFAVSSPLIFRTTSTFNELISVFEKNHTKSMLIFSIVNTMKANFKRYILEQKSVKLKIYIYLIHHVFYIKKITTDPGFPPQEITSLASWKAKTYFNFLIDLRNQGKDTCPRLYNLEVLVLIVMRQCQKWGKKLFQSKSEVYLFEEYINTLDEYLYTLIQSNK